MDDITQPIGPPVPQQPGTATPGHTHGPNLPEVAAATPDERARAEALWKASVANAERWRDPAAAAGCRCRAEDEAGRGRPVRFLHVPTRPGAPTAASSTRPTRRRSSTGTGPATG